MAEDGTSEGAPTRAALIAQMLATPTDTSQAAAPPPLPPPSPEEQPPAPVDVDGDETADADVDEPDDADEVETAPVEDKDEKGHQAIKRAEVRMRQEMAAREARMQADHERAVAEIRPKLAELERLQSLLSRSKHDTDALVELLGLADDDFEPHAQGLFARSPKYKDDPKAKAYAAQSLRARQEKAERDALAKRLDAIETDRKEAARLAEVEKSRQQFLGEVRKAVGDKTPLVKALAAKNPEKLERMVAATGLALMEKFDRVPTAAEVVAEVEKRRKSQRAEFVEETEAAAAVDAGTGKKEAAAKAAKPKNGANGEPKFKTREEALAAFTAGQLD